MLGNSEAQSSELGERSGHEMESMVWARRPADFASSSVKSDANMKVKAGKWA
jgi:hypothetical protein